MASSAKQNVKEKWRYGEDIASTFLIFLSNIPSISDLEVCQCSSYLTKKKILCCPGKVQANLFNICCILFREEQVLESVISFAITRD